jgi:hypothetical protein
MPIEIIVKLMKEFEGLLSYIYLLQSSIEQWSIWHPLSSDCVVYRGFQTEGAELAVLYESMIGEVIFWGGFTSASFDRELTISQFVGGSDGIIFEITLHPGDVAASIASCSCHPGESEILIAAGSCFMVDSVDRHSFEDFTIPLIRLAYFVSWHSFDLDRLPPRHLL